MTIPAELGQEFKTLQEKLKSQSAALADLEKTVAELRLLQREVATLKQSQQVALQTGEKQSGSSSGAQQEHPSHTLGNTSACSFCKLVAEQGRKAGHAELFGIPGVKEALAFNQEMAKMGHKDQGWHEAPGALSAVQMHQVLMLPVDAVVET